VLILDIPQVGQSQLTVIDHPTDGLTGGGEQADPCDAG